MLTKNDLSQIKTVVQETIKPEIKTLGTEIKTLKKNIKTLEQSMSTKEDIKALESRLVEKIDEAQMEIIATVDKHKADKDNVRVLGKRVERLEDNAGFPPHLD